MMIFRKLRGRTLLASAGVLMLAMTGCSDGGNDPTGNAGRDGGPGPVLSVYNGASGQFVENYNPLSPTVLSGVQGMVYEPLFHFNNLASLETPADPLLGEKYAFDAAGTRLSVTLKSGVKWSDGQAFTAKDVAFTFNLIRRTPELNTTGNAPKATAVDDTRVTLTFDAPSFTDGPSILGTTYIVPEHLWKSKKTPATDINANPVGTGPMKVSQFTAQSYLLERNASFRAADKLKVAGVRVFSLSGNQAATDKLLAKELDWAGIFIPNVDKVLRAVPEVSYSATGSQQVVLNTCANAALGCTGPQTSKAVRQAIYYAMNRDQINQLAYFGKGSKISPTFALLDRDQKFLSPATADAAPMSPDLARAQQLLEADGWAKGSDGIYAKDGKRLSMTALVTTGYTDYIATLEAMTQQLKAAGIEIKAQQVANNDNLSTQSLGKFQLAISGLFQGPVGDPYYIYGNSFSTSRTAPVGKSANPYHNVSRFSDPVVDAAVKQAAGTGKIETKAAAYAKIQAVIVDQMPYIPVLNNVSFAEFSRANYDGWPTYENQYASASPGSAPGNGLVLTKLQPK